MPFCAIVEWDQDVSGALSELSSGQDEPAASSLVRIFGSSESGTYAIELWDSSEDAKRFSEESAPALARSALAPPARVTAFETSSVFIR